VTAESSVLGQSGHCAGCRGCARRWRKLERLPDQRCPIGVGADGIDEAAVDVGAHVEVAEPRPADGAPLIALCCSLTLMSSPLIRTWTSFMMSATPSWRGPDALAEVFLRRDQPDALLGELPFGDAGVDVVTERPRPHIDEDVLDLGVLARNCSNSRNTIRFSMVCADVPGSKNSRTIGTPSPATWYRKPHVDWRCCCRRGRCRIAVSICRLLDTRRYDTA